MQILLRSKIATLYGLKLDELKLAVRAESMEHVPRAQSPIHSAESRVSTTRGFGLIPPTLITTAESFVNRSPRGYFADELGSIQHLAVCRTLHSGALLCRATRQNTSRRKFSNTFSLIFSSGLRF
jgi:hypothetical protein